MLDTRGQKRIPDRITRTLTFRGRHYFHRGKQISYARFDQEELIRRRGGLRGTEKFRVEYVPTRNRFQPTGFGWLRVRKGGYMETAVGLRAVEFCTPAWKELFGTHRMGWIRLIPLKGGKNE